VFIETIPEATATGEVADYYAQQRRIWGFLPDYAGAFSLRPEVAQAWGRLSITVRNGMDRRRYEVATIAAARALGSTYCTVAHSKFLRDECGDEATVRTLAADPEGAALDEQDRAVIAFATKVALDACSVRQEDVDRLREAGLDDRDIADVAYAVGVRAFFTRVLDGLGAQLDAETARAFDTPLLEAMVVGRPVGPDPA
jgi:uncharacterized peroxidase-related enzyme